VQGELARALSLIEGRAVVVHGAGRTDAGVHALGQVASVELRREISGDKLRAAINGNLAPDVRVIEAQTIDADFHARYSARGKTYCYRVFNARYASPFLVRYTHTDARPLDLARMRECALLFVGTHDWTAFSAAQADVETRVRTVTQVAVRELWSEEGRGRLVEITARAEGFLRYMVRSIAGTLLEVGRGQMDAAQVALALDRRERSLAGATAPAKGLTLVEVHYE
jgi:tRNA pseudouridine38-40 synthase